MDPLKDSQGRQNDLQMRITSPQRVMIERGVDPEEILNEWKEYEDLVASAGLSSTDFSKGGKAGQDNALSEEKEIEDNPNEPAVDE